MKNFVQSFKKENLLLKKISLRSRYFKVCIEQKLRGIIY